MSLRDAINSVLLESQQAVEEEILDEDSEQLDERNKANAAAKKKWEAGRGRRLSKQQNVDPEDVASPKTYGDKSAVLRSAGRVLSKEDADVDTAAEITEMKYQDDSWKLVKTYPAQSDKHSTAKVYKNITGKHYRNNEDFHIQVIEKGKVYEPGEGFADNEEDAHMQAKHISGHTMKESVQTGGGATGISFSADAQTKQAQAPGASKRQGDLSPNRLSDGVTGVEDTDTENNTNATGNSAANAKTIAAKSTVAKEHLEIMFDGQELSEEFKEKATTLFEAAISAQVAEITEDLEVQFNAALQEAIEAYEQQSIADLQELVDTLDKYLDYVVEEWVAENEIAVESSLRSEITEEFIEGLKGLFNEHYIDIPEEKVDVVEDLSAYVEELENKLNEQLNENIELMQVITAKVGDEVFLDIAEGLTVTQTEKLKKLSESLEFDSVDNYKKKLNIIKENYFPSAPRASGSGLLEESFDGEEEHKPITGPMAQYMNAISRTTVKI
jgi:hypothetical protein